MNGTESNLCKVELQIEIISSEFLVERIVQLYGQICMLESLKPSTAVNAFFFTQLVHACTMPICIDVNKLQRCDEIRTLCKQGRLKEALHALYTMNNPLDSTTYASIL